MIENKNYVYINKNPSSAKIKINQLPNNNIIFFPSKIIPHPKSQSKRKTCKEKVDEENNKFKKEKKPLI